MVTVERSTSTSHNSTKIDEILQLARAGFRVFPLKPRDKAPLTGNGLKDATTDGRTIVEWNSRWPNANWAMAHGETSGTLVLDVDGAKGLESLAKLGIELPDHGPRVSTGREDGSHLFFRYPNYPTKNIVAKLGEGLDIRTEGGYTVIPPSIHATGVAYKWLEPLDRGSLLDVPDWLEARLREVSRTSYSSAPIALLTEGSRDIRLTSEAGTLRRRGYSQEAIEGALKARNRFDSEEPLPEEQVEKIARSIGAKTPGNLLIDGAHTEANYANRLALHQGHEIRYVEQWNRWVTWNGSRWVIDESKGAEMQGRAKGMLTAAYFAADSITNSDKEEQRKKQDEFRDEVRAKESKRAIDAIIDLTRSESGILVSPKSFDLNPFLLNLTNGMLDLQSFSFSDDGTESFRSHDSSAMLTKIASVAFDPSAQCPTWERFISEVFNNNPELMGYVQRSLGYSLCGDTTEHAFWIAYGGGANGKSTLLNTVQSVMGDYAATTPFTTFDAENRNQYGNDVAALMGRRFVAALEADSNKKLSEARVKSVSAGDPYTCKFLYGEYFTFIPQFKTWLAVNHKPIIRGQDRGIWRRLKLIPFEVNFEAKADKNLSEKLKAELPGILNWLLRGFVDWRENGIREPEIVRKATEEYRKDSDQLGHWIRERCELTEGEPIPTNSLYADYRQWLIESGDDRYPWSLTTFGRELGEMPEITKFQETKGDHRGRMVCKGIVLRNDFGRNGSQLPLESVDN